MQIKRLRGNQSYFVVIDKVVGKAIIRISVCQDWGDLQTPFGKMMYKDTSIVRCRDFIKRNCKDVKLINEGVDTEVYSIKSCGLPFKHAVLIGKTKYGNEKYIYLKTEIRTVELEEDVVKNYIINKSADFVDLALNNEGNIIVKKVDYSKCREWLDTDEYYNDMWSYIEKMKKFNDKQKEYIRNYIEKNNYGIDTEDLIDFMTQTENWFPSKFSGLDTQCRDRAFDLMVRFKVINPYKCKYFNKNYIDWISKEGSELLKPNKLFS